MGDDVHGGELRELVGLCVDPTQRLHVLWIGSTMHMENLRADACLSLPLRYISLGDRYRKANRVEANTSCAFVIEESCSPFLMKK